MYAKSDTRSSLISQAVIRIATDMGIESYVREIRHGYSICAGEFVIVGRKNYDKKRRSPCTQ